MLVNLCLFCYFDWTVFWSDCLLTFVDLFLPKIFTYRIFVFLDVVLATFLDSSTLCDRCSLFWEEVFRGLWLVPFAMDEVPFTVHVHNPFLEDDLVRAYRHGSALLSWNGSTLVFGMESVGSSSGEFLHLSQLVLPLLPSSAAVLLDVLGRWSCKRILPWMEMPLLWLGGSPYI